MTTASGHRSIDSKRTTAPATSARSGSASAGISRCRCVVGPRASRRACFYATDLHKASLRPSGQTTRSARAEMTSRRAHDGVGGEPGYPRRRRRARGKSKARSRREDEFHVAEFNAAHAFFATKDNATTSAASPRTRWPSRSSAERMTQSSSRRFDGLDRIGAHDAESPRSCRRPPSDAQAEGPSRVG